MILVFHTYFVLFNLKSKSKKIEGCRLQSLSLVYMRINQVPKYIIFIYRYITNFGELCLVIEFNFLIIPELV